MLREAPEYGADVITEHALYVDGRRHGGRQSVADVIAASREPGALAVILLDDPSEPEVIQLADLCDLHELATEDTLHAHQRSKIEEYGHTVFCVLRPARYLAGTETVEFDELHMFMSANFIVIVRHGLAPDVPGVLRGLEARPDLLRRGPIVVLHAVMDRVVDEYAPVAARIEDDIDEIEDAVFTGRSTASQRIYELTREVIAFQRALKPLGPVVDRLLADSAPDSEDHRYLRDVHDHVVRLDDRVDGFRALLDTILRVSQSLESQSLAEAATAQGIQTKKISAWAAIIFGPTIIGTIYGMNFRSMPELGWRYGYLFALGLMALVAAGLYVAFKRRGWL